MRQALQKSIPHLHMAEPLSLGSFAVYLVTKRGISRSLPQYHARGIRVLTQAELLAAEGDSES
jgi:hypothetical protein